MADQRQPFRLRFPWFSTSQPATAAPTPTQRTQAPSQPAGPPAQRPPFRPAGVAPAQPPPTTAPPARTEPPSPSRSSQGTSKPALQPREARLPQGPPSHAVSQIQVTSRPASPAQVTSKLQQATKTPPQSPSPSRGGAQPTRPKATAAPPPRPSQAKLPSPTKKPQTITTEASQNQKELPTPPPQEPKTLPAFEEPKVKAPTKLVAEVSSPKQEHKPQTEKDFKTTSYKEPKQIRKGSHDEPKKEAIIEKIVIGSKSQTKAHPQAQPEEEEQHSEKEVFEIKEVFKKIEKGSDKENEFRGNERVTRLPHKHANAGGQKAPPHKDIKENLPKYVHKQGGQQEKHLMHEKPFSIVTLTGENIGATMHLRSESLQKERPIHIHRGYKINQDEISEKSADGEGSSRKRNSGDTNFQEDLATKSYVNNNAQGINNSLVFNSTVTERNPGVHMAHSRIPEKPIKPGKERKMIDTHKAEVTSTPAEKLAYAPTIRRRCLQGLFLESSDSDPEKPRRHGCRVGCTQKSKDGTINVL